MNRGHTVTITFYEKKNMFPALRAGDIHTVAASLLAMLRHETEGSSSAEPPGLRALLKFAQI